MVDEAPERRNWLGAAMIMTCSLLVVGVGIGSITGWIHAFSDVDAFLNAAVGAFVLLIGIMGFGIGYKMVVRPSDRWSVKSDGET